MLPQMTKLLSALVLSACLAACASSPVPDKDTTPVPSDRVFAPQAKSSDDQVKITVTRDSAFVGAGCDVGLKLDGKLVAALGTSEQISFYISPGPHTLVITGYGHGLCTNFADKGIETFVRANEPRRYRIVVNQEFSITPA
jgi:hypothetical protein